MGVFYDKCVLLNDWNQRDQCLRQQTSCSDVGTKWRIFSYFTGIGHLHYRSCKCCVFLSACNLDEQIRQTYDPHEWYACYGIIFILLWSRSEERMAHGIICHDHSFHLLFPFFNGLRRLGIHSWSLRRCSFWLCIVRAIPLLGHDYADIWVYDQQCTQSIRYYMVLWRCDLFRIRLLLLLDERDSFPYWSRKEISLQSKELGRSHRDIGNRSAAQRQLRTKRGQLNLSY